MQDQELISGGQTGPGTMEQRVRLWSGLTLFGYVLFHFINHSLGHFSLAAMEAMLVVQETLVDNIAGMTVLYGALLTHSALGIWKLVTLRNWRRPSWEWAQIALGLAIPWFLISHIVYTRGADAVLGVDVGYRRELALIWPGAAWSQSMLMLAVWLHGSIGIHFWLRIRPWYSGVFPVLLGAAVLVPLLALTGWITAARRLLAEMELAAATSSAGRAALAEFVAGNRFLSENLAIVESVSRALALAAVLSVVAVMAIRLYLQRFGERVQVTYANGSRVAATPGQSLLDISRLAGIPHMSVCGGRARCSTCRTLIIIGNQNVTPPTDAEAALLSKLDAGPEIRLACQARIIGDVTVRPLIPPQSNVITPRNADPLGWGVERELAVFFLDIRGFSQIAEHALPYDVVFILNSLFAEVGAAVESCGGYIDKFMGDGMMVIFGLASSPREADRQAIRAAMEAQTAVERANRVLDQHLRKPLRVGIGIHSGQAVVGRIGRASGQASTSRLTAIGETVNIAARLEQATKELGVGLLISAATFESAGIAITGEIGKRHAINVRNISEPVDVVAIRTYAALREALAIAPDPTGTSRPIEPPNGAERASADTQDAKKTLDV
jgi:adenylate cyclase